MKYYNLKVIQNQADFKLNINLRNLGDVNYFAGETNSGKSMLMQCIHEQNDNIGFIKDSASMAQFWDPEVKEWNDYFSQGMIILDILDHKLASEDPQYTETIDEVKMVLDEFGYYEDNLISKGQDNLDTTSTAASKKVFNLLFWMLFKYLKDATTEFVIDEPECHLHPYLTKTIPILLEFLAEKYTFQFFVATHSPFILSAVARITYEETQIKQSVYFLSHGVLVNKRGENTKDAESGYWGQKLIPVANNVLGSGLQDLFIEQAIEPDEFAPILILCEGEKSNQDAKVYNRIFKDLQPRVLFVSCKGSSQLYRSFQLLNEIKPGLSGNFIVYMIRDRDYEFPSMQDIKNWEADHPNAKILTKRAIECYLFSTENAIALNNKFNQKIDQVRLRKLEQIQSKIQIETENGTVSSNYKDDLKVFFNEATHALLETAVKEGDHYETLASFITPQTKSYRELFNDIFK